MPRFSRHPRFERLSELADGSLSAEEQRLIRRHLERCNRCRREIGFVRDVDVALREVPIPSLPDGMLDGIMARRAGGLRTILPDGPVRPPAAPSWKPAAAAAAAVIAIGALVTLFVPGGEVLAGASSFRVSAPPLLGGTTAAVYEPGSFLRERSEVRARARVWLSADPTSPFTIEAGVLDAEGDRYAGPIHLPAGTGYAVIALEDPSASEIDANGGAFWRFDATAEAEATAGAFRARIEALEDLAGLGLVPTSQPLLASIEATRRHPDSPDLWRVRAYHEALASTGEAERVSLLNVHRSMLTGFVRDLGPSPDASRIVMLADYAETIGAVELRSELFDRLESTDPDHPRLIEAAAESLFTTETPSRQTLERAEALFDRAGGRSQFAALVGYELAKTLGDTDALLVWSARMWELDPETRDQFAIDLAQHPELRTKAIELLRERLAFHERPPPAARGLHQTASDFESDLRFTTSRLHAELGKALIAEGRMEAGVEALQRSMDQRWDPVVASLLVEHADSPRAARPLVALIVADPLYRGSPTAAFDLTAAELYAAELDLETRLFGRRPSGALPDDIRFRSRFGDPVEIDDGGVTLIALWRVPPHPGSDEAIEFAGHVGRLASAGVRVLVATPETRLDDAIVLADMAGARPVLDQEGRAARRLGTADVWDYVVVHDRFYSVQYDLAEATRLALLQSEIARRGR